MLQVIIFRRDKRERVIQILEFVRKNMDKKELPWIKAQLVKKHFDGQNPDAQFGTFVRGINDFAESYLCFLEIQENKSARMKTLLSYAKRKNLFKNFSDILREKKEALEEEAKNYDYYFDMFHYLFVEYFHPNTNKHEEYATDLLQKVIDLNLDKYLILSLKLACEAHESNRIVGTDYEQSNLENILKQAKIRQEENKIVEVYYFIYQLLIEEKRIEVEQLPSYFKKKKNLFSIEEQLELLNYLVNYINKLIVKTGEKRYSEALLPLQAIRFEYKQAFDIQLFTGTIQMGLYLGKLHWGAKTIQKSENLIPDNYRDIVVMFCWAMHDYYSGNLQHAATAFNQIKTKEETIMVKTLAFQILCLISDFVLEDANAAPLAKIIRELEKHLEQHTKGTSLKEYYSNFLRFVQRIVFEKNDYENLLSEMANTEKLAAKTDLTRLIKQKIQLM